MRVGAITLVLLAWAIGVAPFAAVAQPHVSSVVHVGPISIAFLSSDDTSAHAYLTLEEGLRQRLAVIHERNSQTLWIDNLSDKDLFVQSADLIKGGQQDRMISYDQILSSHDTAQDITVFCVEKGRSIKRGDEPIETFSASDHSAPVPHLHLMAQHELTAKLLVPKVGGLTAPDKEQLKLLELVQVPQNPFVATQDPAQQAIWADVEDLQSTLTSRLADSVTKNASPTSLELSLEHAEGSDDAQDLLDDFAEIEIPENAIGYLYAAGNTIVGGHAYASHRLFQQMWPKLERSLTLYALSVRPANGSVGVDTFVSYLEQSNKGKEASTHSNGRTEIHVWETPVTYLFETRDSKFPEMPWLHREYVTK